MDHVIDSNSCTGCGHAHWPTFMEMMHYDTRRDRCCEPGCDCSSYEAPPFHLAKVYKCATCHRMVSRVWTAHTGGYTCDECHDDE